MLYLLWLVLRNAVAPLFSSLATDLGETVGVIIIICIGMTMLLSAVGIKISTNLGATIVNNIFRSIGTLLKHLLKAIAWIGKGIAWVLKQTFNGVKNGLSGLPGWASTLIAIFATFIVLVVII